MLEGQLNETLVQTKDSERRLKEMDERRIALAPGLDVEDRCHSLVAGWLSSRLRGYLPPGEVDEVYRKPLFDADDQNPESAEVELHTLDSEVVSLRSTPRLTVTSLW